LSSGRELKKKTQVATRLRPKPKDPVQRIVLSSLRTVAVQHGWRKRKRLHKIEPLDIEPVSHDLLETQTACQRGADSLQQAYKGKKGENPSIAAVFLNSG